MTKTELHFILESAPWPALMIDAGGTVRRANQVAIDFFGPKVDVDSTLLSAIWSEENECSPEQFLVRLERCATAVIPLKFRGKGAGVTLFSTCICPLNRDGEKRFLLQLFRDSPASSLKPASPASTPTPPETGPQTVEANLAQKQKLDCALQLTRTVALDFNNALTSILGHTSLVLSQMEPENPWRASLMEVERAAEKAAEIAHQLAAFTQPEKEPQRFTPGNLNGVLRRVVESLQQSKAEGVALSSQLEDKLYSTKFDEGRVQQALVSILENAIEAARETGGGIHVASQNLVLTEPRQDGTAHLAPGCYVCVEIADGGPGIEADVLPRIFEPFFTTKEGHRGLGLARVYGVITNHGGGVAVSSQPGQGTTVRVYLPATKRFVKERPVKSRSPASEQTILMVDDEDLLLTLVQTILSAHGYRVVTANSGAKALEVLANNDMPVDLVITDLVMPEMSGRELIEQIRLVCPDTPIICTSGYMRPAAAEDQEAFLQKPFTTQELLSSVEQALEMSEAA